MSSRFEKEIEELLRRLETDDMIGQQDRRRPRGVKWKEQLRRIMARRWGFLTTEQLIAILVALVLFSYVSRFALPAIGRYVALGFLAGVVVLFLYLLYQEVRRQR